MRLKGRFLEKVWGENIHGNTERPEGAHHEAVLFNAKLRVDGRVSAQ